MNEQFLKESLLLLKKNQYDLKTRKLIGIFVKNLLKDHWETYASNDLRETIFNLLP